MGHGTHHGTEFNGIASQPTAPVPVPRRIDGALDVGPTASDNDVVAAGDLHHGLCLS